MRASRLAFRLMLALPLASALGLSLGGSAHAQELSGRAIIGRVDRDNRAKDEAVELTMHVVGASGQRRSRSLALYFKAGGEAGADDRILVRFVAPPELKGVGLLTLESKDGDSQWLYLPALRKSKRLAGASRSGSFADSDFSHYDIRTESTDEHDYDLLGEQELDGRPCYKVEARPKTNAVREASGYSRRVTYVDKERWVATRIEFYDLDGALLKVLTTSGWTETAGLWRASEIRLENRRAGTQTVVEFDAATRRINEGLDEAFFSRRTLERP